MASVVTEYTILVPIMLLVIIVFPLTATSVVNNYTEHQRIMIAQGAVNQLANTIQQLEYSLNKDKIMPCTVIKSNPLPNSIDSYPYHALGQLDDSNNKLTISLSLQGLNITVNKNIILSQNTLWSDSTLSSLSSDAGIKIQKFTNGTIVLSFK